MDYQIQSWGRDFSPFTLKINIVNKRELELIWAVFNCSRETLVNSLNKGLNGIDIEQFGTDEKVIHDFSAIFESIDDRLQPKRL